MMPAWLRDLLKEAGYWTAHGLMLVGFLVAFKSIAAGPAGDKFPGLRQVAAVA